MRHKILDVIGDIALLGKSLKAHLVCVRPGHALNSEITVKLAERMAGAGKKKLESAGQQKGKAHVEAHETALDVRRVLDVLPHRFPFVMIDKVISIDGEESL
ncbi:MAG: 3-hydroxyacyl-[acyl-carrier-protein] dehydratase FabZ, partial [Opitutae bacterium]|nr:3-hydroxyacyl-[acyl-carrier-protein] dehydratase FabZ [Opitutae bacterium]